MESRPISINGYLYIAGPGFGPVSGERDQLPSERGKFPIRISKTWNPLTSTRLLEINPDPEKKIRDGGLGRTNSGSFFIS